MENFAGKNALDLFSIRREIRHTIARDNYINIDVENSEFKNSYEPERIYLYNFTNNAAILDYVLGTSATNKSTSKFIFGGYIKKDATSKRGVSYKVNITNHIRNLVKYSDARNVKLGVVVTEDINVSDFKKLRTTNDFISQAPKASVMNPLGTILYGNNLPDTDVNYSKRLHLEIYYTKPK